MRILARSFLLSALMTIGAVGAFASDIYYYGLVEGTTYTIKFFGEDTTDIETGSIGLCDPNPGVTTCDASTITANWSDTAYWFPVIVNGVRVGTQLQICSDVSDASDDGDGFLDPCDKLDKTKLDVYMFEPTAVNGVEKLIWNPANGTHLPGSSISEDFSYHWELISDVPEPGSWLFMTTVVALIGRVARAATLSRG